MNAIKERRLKELTLSSYPDLYVGSCVPFYFCPRSIMLYLISQANHPDLAYRDGQGPIIHLEADLGEVVACANEDGLRWAFTLQTAGSYYFDDRCDLADLCDVDWDAVEARNWQGCKDGKQAEFLIEHQLPWELISRIGVMSQKTYNQVARALQKSSHQPQLQIIRDWYY